MPNYARGDEPFNLRRLNPAHSQMSVSNNKEDRYTEALEEAVIQGISGLSRNTQNTSQ